MLWTDPRYEEQKFDLHAPDFSARVNDPELVQHFAIADLHSNTIKLLCILINRGAVSVNPELYQSLYDCYYNFPVFFNENDSSKLLPFDQYDAVDKINFFRQEIRKIKVSEDAKNKFFLLMGDGFNDRGRCDIFTILLLQELSSQGLVFSILISNHDLGLLYAYANDYFSLPADEINRDFPKKYGINVEHCHSLYSMNALIAQGFIDRNELRAMVKNVFVNRLKALEFLLVEQTKNFYLFSHAPIGLETVKSMAEKLLIDFRDPKPKELGLIINQINEKFSANICSDNLTNFLAENFVVNEVDVLDSLSHPFRRACWNRSEKSSPLELNLPDQFKLTPVFGHIGEINLIATRSYGLNLLGAVINFLDSNDVDDFGLLPNIRDDIEKFGYFSEETMKSLSDRKIISDNWKNLDKLVYALMSKKLAANFLNSFEYAAFRKQFHNTNMEVEVSRWWKINLLKRGRSMYMMDSNLGKTDDKTVGFLSLLTVSPMPAPDLNKKTDKINMFYSFFNNLNFMGEEKQSQVASTHMPRTLSSTNLARA